MYTVIVAVRSWMDHEAEIGRLSYKLSLDKLDSHAIYKLLDHFYAPGGIVDIRAYAQHSSGIYLEVGRRTVLDLYHIHREVISMVLNDV